MRIDNILAEKLWNKGLMDREIAEKIGCSQRGVSSWRSLNNKESNYGKLISDLIGKRFGRLLVLEYRGRAKDRKHMWLCRCDCGNEKVYLENNFKRSKHTQSCGCFGREKTIKRNTTHNLHGDPLYRTWANMRQRCMNSNHRDFNRYGGRGISICEEWDSAENFIKWGHSNGWKDGLTLDRSDNDGNYCPDNCKFVTMKIQDRNKSNNVRIEYNGESKILWDWAKELSMCYGTLRLRYGKGDRGDKLFRPSRGGPTIETSRWGD